jgi:type I restriction enzyme S subunit
MENVEPNTGAIINFVPRKGKTIKSSCVHFDKGHILYGKLRPYLRKVVDCSELPFEEGIASSEFLSLRPKENVLQSWLSFLLRSTIIAEQAKVAIGARMPRISPDSLLDFVIPLPPLAVQKQIMKRVVAGCEEIAFECETIKQRKNDINTEVEELILGTKRLEVF